MAKTKTQKDLLKASRAGSRSYAENRVTNAHYAQISQHERVKPGKEDGKAKHKKRMFAHESEASAFHFFVFFVCAFLRIIRRAHGHNANAPASPRAKTWLKRSVAAHSWKAAPLLFFCPTKL